MLFHCINHQETVNIRELFPLNGSMPLGYEADAQTPLIAGKFTKLKVNVSFNDSIQGNAVFTLRVNGSSTTLTLSVPFGQTGIFNCEQTVNTQDNDMVCIEADFTSMNESFDFRFNMAVEFQPN